MDHKWLLLLVRLDEEMLLRNPSYTALPDSLATAIHKSSNAVDLSKLYLLGNKQKKRIEQIVRGVATDYHHYAVTIQGERCTDPTCEEHQVSNVLDFNAYYNARNRKSSRLN